MFKYDIIQIIFKFCVSQMYLIVLLYKIKRTYDQINMIGVNLSSLSRIGPIPTINIWFLLHTRK